MTRFTDFHEDLNLPADAIAQLAEDAGNTGADQFGVSCSSSRLCIGAGGYNTNSRNLLAYLAVDASGPGAGKTPAGVTLPSNVASPARSFLSNVSCASDGYCVAVGFYDYKVVGSTAWFDPMVAVRS